MTLQQLKYIIEIVNCGSITMAAQRLYIAQPSLSKAVVELEQEMGITIFHRSNRGVILSEEGTKFLSYARQVVEQAELLENTYKRGEPIKRVFAWREKFGEKKMDFGGCGNECLRVPYVLRPFADRGRI